MAVSGSHCIQVVPTGREPARWTEGTRPTLQEIENQTILIPDVSMTAPGDLLVNHSDENGPHIGIVIKTDGTREGTYLLSTRKGFQMMTMGKWLNGNQLFNSFTIEPQRYQIRRIISYAGKPENVKAVPEWDLLQYMPEITCELNFENDTMPNWIPNTKVKANSSETIAVEPVVFGNIMFYNNDQRINTEEPVKLLPPVLGRLLETKLPR